MAYCREDLKRSICLCKVFNEYFYDMRPYCYLIILVLYLSIANVSSDETGKKGPKVTDKVSLALPQLCTWY